MSSPRSRTTITVLPPACCATLLVTSGVPSAQLVLVTVPAAVSIVVVPAAVQLQLGAVRKLAFHCIGSTASDGGTRWFVHIGAASVAASTTIGPASEPASCGSCCAERALKPHPANITSTALRTSPSYAGAPLAIRWCMRTTALL